MSCMVMSKEPLAALANAVETRLDCDFNYWGFDAPLELYKALDECRTHGLYSAEEIYKRLYAVNIRAYNGRYAGHEEPSDEEVPDVDLTLYRVHHAPQYREHGFAVCPWHYQLAKLLDFWLYQTDEDATSNDPLRIAMRMFRDSLYRFIICNSREYTEIGWGQLPTAETKEE